VIAGDDKSSLAEEGELPEPPPPLLELAPLIGVEEPVVVWHVEVLADQPEHLGLGPEGVVADNNRRDAMLDVHNLCSKSRKINFIFFLIGFVDKSGGLKHVVREYSK